MFGKEVRGIWLEKALGSFIEGFFVYEDGWEHQDKVGEEGRGDEEEGWLQV